MNQHGRKKSGSYHILGQAYFLAHVPRNSIKSSPKCKEHYITRSNSIYLLPKPMKRPREIKEKKDRSLGRSSYQTRSMERLQDMHKTAEINGNDVHRELKSDRSHILALKIAKIKKLVDGDQISHRLLQGTEEIERTQHLIQQEKAMLLKEFRNLTNCLKGLQDENLRGSQIDIYEDKNLTHRRDTNPAFRDEILDQINRLKKKYKALEKDFLELQKPKHSGDALDIDAKRLNEQDIDIKKEEKLTSSVRDTKEDVIQKEEQVGTSSKVTRINGRNSERIDVRKSSFDNTLKQYKHKNATKELDDDEDKEDQKEKSRIGGFEFNLKDLEKREKVLQTREEKLEKRFEEFRKEKEDFEEYKKEFEEKFRKEHKKIKEQKELLEKFEHQTTERHKILENNERDLERLTRELEEQNEELIRKKEVYERDIKDFDKKVERFESDKEEFIMFEKEFHKKNLEFKAEKEKNKLITEKISKDSAKLERKYEEYYEQYAELEAKRQILQKKEEELIEKEKMIDEKMKKTKEEKEYHPKKERSNEMGETRLKLKQEDITRRDKNFATFSREKDYISSQAKSFAVKLSTDERQKGREKGQESFSEDTNKDYEEQIKFIKPKERSNKKKVSKMDIENRAPEEISSSTRIVAPDNSWNDKTILPLSSRILNLENYDS